MTIDQDGGGRSAPSNPTEVHGREDLAFVLSEASTLEHMIMCEYLFAAFSLKRSEPEGLNARQLEAVKRWEEIITTVAIQEMTHLALVNNMLVSIGSSPYFQHGNFPQPSRYFSPNIRLALVPFSEQALRHFIYLERPEGMSIEGVPGFEVLGDLNPVELKSGVVPKGQYFSTVGALYRRIERGFADLVEKHGDSGVFIGAEYPQATMDLFGLPSLFEVKDLASAKRAVEGIVEMGEGARGDWKNAHFGMFLSIFKDFMEMKKQDSGFQPTKPVVAAYVRPPIGVDNVPLITDPQTAMISDLFNACYGLVVQILSRFYVHESEYPSELRALADAAVGMMANVVKPVGLALTELPVGPHLPGLTAGPSFELQHREFVLPHRKQAFTVLQERLLELAGFSANISQGSLPPALSSVFRTVQENLSTIAGELHPTPLGG